MPLLSQAHVQNFVFEMNFFQKVSWSHVMALFEAGTPIQLHIFEYSTLTKSLQSCPTLCNPIDGSPPGSPVPGILQARTLEWVAISLSNAGK